MKTDPSNPTSPRTSPNWLTGRTLTPRSDSPSLSCSSTSSPSQTMTRRSKIGKVLYLDLADFVACYLSHMAVEERQVMPVLAAALTFDELLATPIAVRSSIPPAQMVASLTFMLPAMNIDERTTMLGQMHSNAPADAFAYFWSIANDVLDPADVQAVACRIGLG